MKWKEKLLSFSFFDEDTLVKTLKKNYQYLQQCIYC